MRAPLRMVAVGFTLFLPVYLGAEPWIGSKTAMVVAHVGAWGHAQAAHQAGAEVAQDVAKQVGGHDHVVLVGPLDELHAHVVHDAVVELDLRVVGGHLAGNGQEQPVRDLEDVALVHGGNLVAAVGPGVVEGVTHDALAGARVMMRMASAASPGITSCSMPT